MQAPRCRFEVFVHSADIKRGRVTGGHRIYPETANRRLMGRCTVYSARIISDYAGVGDGVRTGALSRGACD